MTKYIVTTMQPDDMTDIAPESRRSALDGIRVMFRAYLDEQGEPRLIWKIGSSVGNNATLDPTEAHVLLPPGRQVHANGERISYIIIPQWLSDALTEDIEALCKANPNAVDDWNPKSAEPEEPDEEVEPMFDSLETDDER